MTRKQLCDELDSLKLELTEYNRDILYMSVHRKNILEDVNITGEFKHPILEVIDEEIYTLDSICKDLEKEIKHLEGFINE
jgi:hypothetical protein